MAVAMLWELAQVRRTKHFIQELFFWAIG